MLYPLKFDPIIKEKVWGGQKLKTYLNKPIQTENAGESWELSGIKNDESCVSNGFLKGKCLSSIVNEYKEILLGKKVFEIFGSEFPLLIKFIDAADDLSVQVHPGDDFAKKTHQQNGKNEIWYILEAEPEAQLVLGLNKKLSKEEYMKAVKAKTIQNSLNRVDIKKGDVAFIPAGRIHAIMKGVLLAEIQQTSDITYRIYDWDRKDLNGQYRPLHTELAAQVVDLEFKTDYLTKYVPIVNNSVQLIQNQYFTVCIIELSEEIFYDISMSNSFIILMNLEGNAFINSRGNEPVAFMKGETVLLPACMEKVQLVSETDSKFLEIYIEPDKI